MEITINGEILQYTIEHEKTIGEVLGFIELQCKEAKATVAQVLVDGKELLPEELDDLFNKPVDTDIKIELSTLSGQDVKILIKSICTQLIDTAEKLKEIPLHMQSGEINNSLNLLSEFSELLNKLYYCFTLFDIAGIDPQLKIHEKSIEEYQTEISPLLPDLVQAVEENDIVTAGDIAEYELGPLVKDFASGLSSIHHI
ncbi:hypothetical protein DWQ65_04540 [Treponema phagedenis]|uniref:Ubiquitin-like domain-containing protein n=1 Tax=Treponema phagedenis TaxID=162 RepID=A0A0B7GT12_TREPH|nr:hypothetical protein [Treponema phagedenis]QEJ95095.1 hypothetical protein FUT79_07700 [Treponema phagedenis]QEJ98233.1 hypothetical protein FUT82_09645 [Treponema phagedenis]QEK03743.1 hypothetical protein FUT83_07955 [Treponema phagedenis]QEK09358.1 hypothetical protein FUT81_07870 [Treponema phagedenis]QSH94539.1 hypothetical protein C5O78_05695 [Treponema phagedenis]